MGKRRKGKQSAKTASADPKHDKILKRIKQIEKKFKKEIGSIYSQGKRTKNVFKEFLER